MPAQPQARPLVEARRARCIEAKLHCGGDLVDVLPAGAAERTKTSSISFSSIARRAVTGIMKQDLR
jgi:hypothetical protein